jgi:hypothetical protein
MQNAKCRIAVKRILRAKKTDRNLAIVNKRTTQPPKAAPLRGRGIFQRLGFFTHGKNDKGRAWRFLAGQETQITRQSFLVDRSTINH